MSQKEVMPILNELYARKKVVLEFESAAARENFRQELYKIKKVQDGHLLSICDERREILCFKFKDVEVVGPVFGDPDVTHYKYLATLYLEEPKEISYNIVSIEDIPAKESNGSGDSKKKISSSLGQAGRISEQASTDSSKVRAINEENPKSDLEREKPRPS